MNRDCSLDRLLAALLLLAYLAILAILVFLPFGRGMDLGDRVNLEPFATIERALEAGRRSPPFWLMIGNVAAFMPFGLLAPLALRPLRPTVALVAAATALSVAIELGQLFISLAVGYAYRSTDVDDVILNVLGAALGYALFVASTLQRRIAICR